MIFGTLNFKFHSKEAGMKVKRWITVGVVSAVLILFAGTGMAQDEKVSMSEWTQIVQSLGDKGQINWSAGYIEAVGMGAPPERYIGKPNARPMALRAAKVDAYRNLLEITRGVQVSSETTVTDFVTESDVIRAQVEGLVKGAMVVNQEYLSDGTVEVTLRMPLYGEFSKAMMSRILEKKKIAPAPEAPPVEPPVETPVAPPVPPVAAPAPVVFTGLVIDARGLQARPAMSPKILDENGKEVYGSMIVERDYAVQQGMTGYARDLTAAQSNPRVTNNPLSVKGVKTEGAGAADIVIGNADAQAIRAATDNLSFLKKCRVMIVLD